VDEVTGNNALHESVQFYAGMKLQSLRLITDRYPHLLDALNHDGYTPFLLEATARGNVNPAWENAGADVTLWGTPDGRIGTVLDYYALVENPALNIAGQLIRLCEQRGIRLTSPSKIAANGASYLRQLVEKAPSTFSSLIMLISHNALNKEDIVTLLKLCAEYRRGGILHALISRSLAKPSSEIPGYGTVADFMDCADSPE
jgi:hypothetical protein